MVRSQNTITKEKPQGTKERGRSAGASDRHARDGSVASARSNVSRFSAYAESGNDIRNATPAGWRTQRHPEDVPARGPREDRRARMEMMQNLRGINVRVVRLPDDDEAHGNIRSWWTEGRDAHRNDDRSLSWKGNKDSEQISAVAVYVHGMSNYSSLKEYVELIDSITSGLIFARPWRNEN